MDDAWQNTAEAEYTPQMVINKTLLFFENYFCHVLGDIKILQ